MNLSSESIQFLSKKFKVLINRLEKIYSMHSDKKIHLADAVKEIPQKFDFAQFFNSQILFKINLILFIF